MKWYGSLQNRLPARTSRSARHSTTTITVFKEVQAMKWFLEITTQKGRFEFPFKGYKTKREATEQKKLADRDPQNLNVRIIKR